MKMIKNVLSLFDGISCGRLALDNVGFEYLKYYASEIDKNANDLVSKKFPDTIQLGDVNEWLNWNLEDIDLIIAGSPCQGFSCTGNQENFNHPKSKLFYVFLEILKHYKPKYFLLENVKMRAEWIDKISDYLGVQPMVIDSSLVSAQMRKRVYWMNWSCESPEDKQIPISDILTSNQDWNSASISGRRIDPTTQKRSDHNKDLPYIQCVEVRQNPSKSGCLTTADKDSVITRFKKGRHLGAYDILEQGTDWRLLDVNEIEALQTLPKNYTEGYPVSVRRAMVGNGWTVAVIEHLLKNLQSDISHKVNKGKDD